METAEIQVGHRSVKTINVQCGALDAWLGGLAVDEIDFIKIDVEGSRTSCTKGRD